jgi:AraC-like DNA-binding protein
MGKRIKQNIQDADIKKVRQWTETGFIEDDIIIIDNIKDAPVPREPRRMSFILVGLCLQGKVEYSIDTKEQVVQKGDIIILSDRHVVEKFSFSPDIEVQCIVLSMPFFYEVIRDMSDLSSLLLFAKSHPVVNLTQQEVNVFSDYFQFIKRKINETDNHYRKRVVSALTFALFCDLSNVIYRLQKPTVRKKSSSEILFTRFIKLVEENYLTERKVSWYAEQLGITAKYLSECVKLVSKRSPNEWIENYVVLEIRLQLKNSNKNIKEIAKDMHFPNQSFLGKYFKEHVGMSPSKYRKS